MTGHGGVIAIREKSGSVIVCLLTHCTESSSFTVVVTGESKTKKSKVNFDILYQLKFKKVERWTQKFAKSFAGVSTISVSCTSAFSIKYLWVSNKCVKIIRIVNDIYLAFKANKVWYFRKWQAQTHIWVFHQVFLILFYSACNPRSRVLLHPVREKTGCQIDPTGSNDLGSETWRFWYRIDRNWEKNRTHISILINIDTIKEWKN